MLNKSLCYIRMDKNMHRYLHLCIVHHSTLSTIKSSHW